MEKILEQYQSMQLWVVRQFHRAMFFYVILLAVGNLIFSTRLSEGLMNAEIQKSLLVYDVLFFLVLSGRIWIRKPKQLLYYGLIILLQLIYEIGFREHFTQISLGYSGVSLVLIAGYLYVRGLRKYGNYSQLLKELMDQLDNDRIKAESQSAELMSMYEELEANDEEVRAQYQEILENRDHLRLIQKRNSLLFKASNEVIWELDLKTGVRHFADENYVDDVELDLIQSIRFEDWAYDLHPEDQRPFVEAMEKVMYGKSQYEVFEIRVNNLHGGWKWLRSKVVSLTDDFGQPIMMAGSYSDIDDRKQKERRIQQLAYHDSLTGLANRVSLLDHISNRLINQEQSQICEGIFCYIDVDDFGAINNTFGHDTGDLLIQTIAKRLTIECPNDFIARIGGADFCVLSHDAVLCEQPELLAEQLQICLSAPYQIDHKEIYLTASIGVTVYTDQISTAEAVLRRGDIALRQAKKQGKNRYCLYENDMSREVSERLLMANELRIAIERDELYLCFQPQVSLKTGQIFGFEALLRWKSLRYGMVPPDRFIPLAEETGLIVPIGNWVMAEACDFLESMIKMDKDITISVNVAAQQLEHPEFLESVRAVLNSATITPENLCLEVTESSLIRSLDQAVDKLEQLKLERVKIALDDFGTGFSSLNYLNHLPIDTLKIDKSFTGKISGSSKEYKLIKSILGLSKDLGLNLVVEGIETEEQLALIESMGRPIIQGYYFGKPMTRSEAVLYMSQYEPFISDEVQDIV